MGRSLLRGTRRAARATEDVAHASVPAARAAVRVARGRALGPSLRGCYLERHHRRAEVGTSRPRAWIRIASWEGTVMVDVASSIGARRALAAGLGCLALLTGCGPASGGPGPTGDWTLAWSRTIWSTEPDGANAIDVRDGVVAVAGTVRGDPSLGFGIGGATSGGFVVALTSAGDLTYAFVQSGFPASESFGVAIDPGGVVHDVGYLIDASDNLDGYVVSHPDDDSGVQEVLIAAGAQTVVTRAVAASASQVLAVGATTGTIFGVPASAGGQDAFLVSFPNPSANPPALVRQFGTEGADGARAVAVDADGRIAVAGFTEGTLAGASAGGRDAFVRLYDADGSVLWTRQWGTEWGDAANGVAFDPEGRVVVGGELAGPQDPPDVDVDLFVHVFDRGGALVWERRIEGDEGWDDFGGDVAVDALGRVFVVGYGPTVGSYARVFDTGGALVWSGAIGSKFTDESVAVAVDADGRMYVAGTSVGVADRGYDATVWVYDPPSP
jgi:hypothetical protein